MVQNYFDNKKLLEEIKPFNDENGYSLDAHHDPEKLVRLCCGSGNNLTEISDFIKPFIKDFQKYDEDGSGFISKDELVAIIKDRTGIDIPQKHIERLMKDSDENDDNQINYEEFVTLMTKSCMQKRVY